LPRGASRGPLRRSGAPKASDSSRAPDGVCGLGALAGPDVFRLRGGMIRSAGPYIYMLGLRREQSSGKGREVSMCPCRRHGEAMGLDGYRNVQTVAPPATGCYAVLDAVVLA